MRALWSVVTLVAAFIAATPVAAAYANRPLAAALRELESRGLKLVYSDDVVRPDMIVRAEPRATEPRRILDELLREHGLRAERGPRNTLLIVRAPAPPPREQERERRDEVQAPMPVALAEIVVTPSRFTLIGDAPESRQFLDRDEVRRLPHLADDMYRAIARVPGTAASDVSARFHLRGGAQDEVQVLLDGAEIYDPFHVKDLSRAFSTIDAEAVGSVDILSGGYPVEYGGRMSGVVDIATHAPQETRTEAGIGLLTTRVLSQGTFREGRGSWLLSARRGYLREVLELIDDEPEIDPRYYDALGKVQWLLGTRGVVSAHLLLAQDKLRLREPGAEAHARHRDSYVWLNARGSLTPRLYAQSVLSLAMLSRHRDGAYAEPAGSESGALDDRRNARIAAWKNDATFDVSPRHLLRAGLTAKSFRASYDYEGTAHLGFSPFELGRPPRDIRQSVHVDPRGHELSAYVADRFRVSERVAIEAGVRVATESHTPDRTHFDPRVQLAWAATDVTALRLAWAVIHQPQRIDELQVEDGATEFGAAQKSIHRVASVEHHFGNGMHGRLELYDKSIRDPQPRYENLYDTLLLFPELRADRVRIAPRAGRARGAEILLRTDATRALSAWLSYSHANVTDDFGGDDVPRAWDQRHASTFSVNYRRGNAWNFNVAGTWHSGWPTTPVVAQLVNGSVVSAIGRRSSERLPAYRRVDFRATRSFRRIDFFVELFNVLNQSNVTRVDFFRYDVSPNGTVTSIPVTESILGVVPSFGITWRF
jgi:TonB dependent receptor/TonB-dependent Receptor Plug Domain